MIAVRLPKRLQPALQMWGGGAENLVVAISKLQISYLLLSFAAVIVIAIKVDLFQNN